MPTLVAPEATRANLNDFLVSEAFFPPNATRKFDGGEMPIPAGPQKFYREFPNDEPSPSSDGKWRWVFDPKGETTVRKVLRLESAAGEPQVELVLLAPTIGVLWAADSGFSALTSWDDERTRRIDVVNPASRGIQRVALNRWALGKFFSYDELDGAWSFQARAWKTNAVLIVRGIKPSTKPGEKLCVAEFSIDLLAARNQLDATQLLRAFVVE
jgi:hypothetical protein